MSLPRTPSRRAGLTSKRASRRGVCAEELKTDGSPDRDYRRIGRILPPGWVDVRQDRGLQDSGRREGAQFRGRAAEEAAVDLVVVLAQLGAEPSHFSRRVTEAGEHVLHRHLAELGMDHAN